MSKTKDQLLLDYRKSNKERRTKILAKAGFATEIDYVNFLLAPDAVPDAEIKVHNVHVIDVSGSMSGAKLRGAVQGINEEVAELKKDPSGVEHTHSIVEFSNSSDIKTVCWKVPIKEVTTYNTYDRGMTALNQAVGETLQRLVKEQSGTDKVLVKIFTDGGENNSSGPFKDKKILAEFIKECEDKGITVTFIGTEVDVKTVINTLNIDASNTLTHDNTSAGIYASSLTRSAATLAYSQKVLKKQDVSKGFYKQLKPKQ